MSYRIFGSTGSPYSVKVRSYFRYKDIEHKWLVRNTPELLKEHAKYSKLPIVPTVISPDGSAIQDSTAIIAAMETLFPEPSIYPPDSTLRFLSELLEEFADEWGNKWMMHFRWYSRTSEADAASYSRRIATEMKSGAPLGTDGLNDEITQMADFFKSRMQGRGFTVGSNEHTAPIIEQSYLDTITLLDVHLKHRCYLFGHSPCLADFGLAGQLYQCLQDVTAGELMRLHAPNVADWCERMVNPRLVSVGGFEEWGELTETLEVFLRAQVSMFLRWSDANAHAVTRGSKEMSVDLGGQIWQQSVGGPQRFHAKTLKEIRRKFAAAKTEHLFDVLGRCGCLELLLDAGASKL